MSAEAVPAEAFPRNDDEVAPFVRDLGIPGLLDIHVHLLPHRLQEAVWAFFDRLDDPPWPIEYRDEEQERLRFLRHVGVHRHTALAYAHKPGMIRWLNDHTLTAAETHAQVIPTFTFHPEPGAAEAVHDALAAGGRVAKVHVQVGRFDLVDPRLDEVWPQLEAARTPVVLHASAVYGVEGGDEFCGAGPVRRLLDRHPGLRLVIAHLAAPQTAEFLDLADETGLWFDTAMALTDPPYFTMPDALVERVRGYTDRLLFGSDFPSIPHAYAAQVRGLAALGLDAAGLRALFHDRAAALLAEVRSPAAPTLPTEAHDARDA